MQKNFSIKANLFVNNKALIKGMSEANAKVQGSMKGIAKSMSSIGNEIKRFAGIAASVFIVRQVSGVVQDLADSASKIRGLSNEFRKTGVSLQFARRQTKGMVSDLKIMETVNLARQFGINANQSLKMMRFAASMAQRLGIDANKALSDIVTGTARGSVKILDNLGISAKRYREELKKTGDSAQAVSNIIDEMGDSVGADGIALAGSQLKALGENMKTSFSEGFMDKFTSGFKNIETTSRELTGVARSLGQALAKIAAHLDTIVTVYAGIKIASFMPRLLGFTRNIGFLGSAMSRASKMGLNFAGKLNFLNRSIAMTGGSLASMVASLRAGVFTAAVVGATLLATKMYRLKSAYNAVFKEIADFDRNTALEDLAKKREKAVKRLNDLSIEMKNTYRSIDNLSREGRGGNLFYVLGLNKMKKQSAEVRRNIEQIDKIMRRRKADQTMFDKLTPIAEKIRKAKSKADLKGAKEELDRTYLSGLMMYSEVDYTKFKAQREQLYSEIAGIRKRWEEKENEETEAAAKERMRIYKSERKRINSILHSLRIKPFVHKKDLISKEKLTSKDAGKYLGGEKDMEVAGLEKTKDLIDSLYKDLGRKRMDFAKENAEDGGLMYSFFGEEGVRGLVDRVDTVSQTFSNAMTSALTNAASATEALKASFKSLAVSMLAQLTAIITKMLILTALKAILSPASFATTFGGGSIMSMALGGGLKSSSVAPNMGSFASDFSPKLEATISGRSLKLVTQRTNKMDSKMV